jgi:hypothetical protein
MNLPLLCDRGEPRNGSEKAERFLEEPNKTNVVEA